jgi:RpiB/LacA/LacB family sugar-phosphate isomerase
MKAILLASDHAGFALKEALKSYLEAKGIKIKDLGTSSPERCDYPAYAYALAKNISLKKYNRGILICKTGIGNSIVANRLPGVRASLCYNAEAAKLTREHNDSNVLVLGSGFVNKKKAFEILDAWLTTEFMGGRHKRRLDQIKEIEKEIGARVK